MSILLGLFGAAMLLELLFLYLPLLWRWRAGFALTAVVVNAFAVAGILAWRPTLASGLIFAASLYRVFNMVRITENRMHDVYLHRATRRTASVLIVLQVAVLIAWRAWELWPPHAAVVWGVLAGLQAAVALALLLSTRRTLRHTTWPRPAAPLADSELPTVSVAIPARNETEDLEACLQSIIASDYPKLEILVLDDCSQNRRTSEIIRGYAQDGVRFVQGEDPNLTWLAKNQAYDRLAREASGQYVLFCGVDVRFAPESIRQLAGLMVTRHKHMASVLPARSASGLALTQSLRYWWELVPPRRLFRRPPVLSTCWMMSRELLHDSGGFQAVARSITPEAHFARLAAAHGDGYGFFRASAASGITSAKLPAAQRATAIRTRYPQLHRRPENVLVLSVLELVFLVLPFGLAVGGWWLHAGLLAPVLALVAVLLLATSYQLLSSATHTAPWWFGVVGVPAGMLYDITLLHRSMWQYEFSTVEWKGRNICIPAMHVVPHLPKVD